MNQETKEKHRSEAVLKKKKLEEEKEKKEKEEKDKKAKEDVKWSCVIRFQIKH